METRPAIELQPAAATEIAPAMDFASTRDPVPEQAFSAILLQSSSKQAPQEDAQGSEMIQLSSRGAVLELALDHPRLSTAEARSLVRFLWDAVRRAQSRVELTLKPSGLGQLAIQIQVEGQRVHLEIKASDPRVVSMLLESRTELSRNLSRWGLVLGRLEAHCLGAEAVAGCAEMATIDPTTHASSPKRRRSFIEVVA